MTRHRYEIRVEGQLDSSWSGWFEGLNLRDERSEQDQRTVTVISGEMDQAALHGALARIRDLGIRLLSVQIIELERTGG